VASRHTLTVAMPSEPAYVDGDPIRLAQVFSNLLNNAAKYTSEGGQIGVDVMVEASEAVIRVRDTGLGIHSAMLPKVFDLFFQLDRSRGLAQGGLGIGLTLVQRLVEMHGGTVEARSDGLNRGSEFLVRLPLAPPVERRARTGAGEPHARRRAVKGRKILVVDDNEDAARALAMLLRYSGNEVRTALDGPTALEFAVAFGPELILLDLGMPGMDGCEVARRIRQNPELETVCLVALTGWGQEDDRRRTRDAGFDHHLVKPVDPDELDAVIRKLRPGAAPTSD
jgi:CheY-like chemotaxis protein/anti-sigma regulatory factor (Ser/Thr protein kinase)